VIVSSYHNDPSGPCHPVYVITNDFFLDRASPCMTLTSLDYIFTSLPFAFLPVCLLPVSFPYCCAASLGVGPRLSLQLVIWSQAPFRIIDRRPELAVLSWLTTTLLTVACWTCGCHHLPLLFNSIASNHSFTAPSVWRGPIPWSRDEASSVLRSQTARQQ
jgi:hypothetical protein